MFDDIAGVQAAANRFLDQLVASDEAPTLGLVSFKDDVTNRGLTCNIDQLRAQINGLFASGGGDCPEAMNAALLSAIQTFPRGRSDIQLLGGRILLATDASARDPGLGPTVADEAFLRGISVDAILTGDCVPESAAPVLALAPGTAGETFSANEPGPLPTAEALARQPRPATRSPRPRRARTCAPSLSRPAACSLTSRASRSTMSCPRCWTWATLMPPSC